MSKLSPAAHSVLTAVTQRKYCLDPEDVNQLAASIASDVATALRAAVAYTKVNPGHDIWQCDANELLAIADELEAQ